MTDQDELFYTPPSTSGCAPTSTDSGTATVVVGITDYAADKLGDVVYVDLPKVGAAVTAGTVVGEIESTKSVGELFAPVDGEVVEANQAVVDAPSSSTATRSARLAREGQDGRAAEAPHRGRVPRPRRRVRNLSPI